MQQLEYKLIDVADLLKKGAAVHNNIKFRSTDLIFISEIEQRRSRRANLHEFYIRILDMDIYFSENMFDNTLRDSRINELRNLHLKFKKIMERNAAYSQKVADLQIKIMEEQLIEYRYRNS